VCDVGADTSHLPVKVRRTVTVVVAVPLKHLISDYKLHIVEVAVTLAELGSAYKALGYPQKAENLLKLSLHIFEGHEPGDLRVATILSVLGDTYMDLGNPHEAKDLLERALTIVENYKEYSSVYFKYRGKILSKLSFLLWQIR
jgi:tetratricopeptide (TPR) repeat protein